MAERCFWAEVLNVVEDCGGGPEPGEWTLMFSNNIIYGSAQFFWKAPGFQQGQGFQLSIPSDSEFPLREMHYQAEYDYYMPYVDGRVAPFNGADRTPGIAIQGANQWPVLVSVVWS